LSAVRERQRQEISAWQKTRPISPSSANNRQDRQISYFPASVAFFASFGCGFFTYLSSHAAQRAHRSRSVSRAAGP